MKQDTSERVGEVLDLVKHGCHFPYELPILAQALAWAAKKGATFDCSAFSPRREQR
jgi:hypothetical protein